MYVCMYIWCMYMVRYTRKEAVGKIAPAMRDLPLPFRCRVYENAPSAAPDPPGQPSSSFIIGLDHARLAVESTNMGRRLIDSDPSSIIFSSIGRRDLYVDVPIFHIFNYFRTCAFIQYFQNEESGFILLKIVHIKKLFNYISLVTSRLKNDWSNLHKFQS